jgi:hypothetical protein
MLITMMKNKNYLRTKFQSNHKTSIGCPKVNKGSQTESGRDTIINAFLL